MAGKLFFALILVIIGIFRPVLCSFDLTVLHVNDIHVRLRQTDEWGGACKPKDQGQNFLSINFLNFYYFLPFQMKEIALEVLPGL